MKVTTGNPVRKWLGYQACFVHTICLDCPKESCNGYCDRYRQKMKEYGDRKKRGKNGN